MSIKFANEFFMSELFFLINYHFDILCKRIHTNKNPPNFKNEVGGFYCIGFYPPNTSFFYLTDCETIFYSKISVMSLHKRCKNLHNVPNNFY